MPKSYKHLNLTKPNYAALANDWPGLESGSNRWPNRGPGVPWYVKSLPIPTRGGAEHGSGKVLGADDVDVAGLQGIRQMDEDADLKRPAIKGTRSGSAFAKSLSGIIHSPDIAF